MADLTVTCRLCSPGEDTTLYEGVLQDEALFTAEDHLVGEHGKAPLVGPTT